VFSKNRDRLLKQEVAEEFFTKLKEQAQGLMSDEHITVDGTLIEAWTSNKIFQPKGSDNKPGGGCGADFRGQKRSKVTHESKTDPRALLYKKSAGCGTRWCAESDLEGAPTVNPVVFRRTCR